LSLIKKFLACQQQAALSGSRRMWGVTSGPTSLSGSNGAMGTHKEINQAAQCRRATKR